MNCSAFARCIACLFFSVTSVGLASAEGLPLQDSFEKGTTTPDGWRKGAAISGVNYVYDKSNGSAGKRSLSLQKSANRYFPIAQWFRVMDHDGAAMALEMSAKVKAAKVTKAIMEIQFLDGGGQMIGKEWVSYIGAKQANSKPVSHTWKEYSGKADVPAGTRQLVVALQIYGPGKVWFDELQVQRAGEAGDANAAPASSEQASDSPPKTQSFQLESGAWTRFVMIPPAKQAAKPSGGYPVLFVLPGGDGSVEFHPFVRRFSEDALEGRFVVIQLIAPPQIVWPTRRSKSRFATTEESIVGVLKKLGERGGIDLTQVFALAWSSSGPAVYSALLQDDSPLSGAFIAMSVFRAKDHADLSLAAGKRVHLLHSPEDRTCPYRMAEDAEAQLRAAGAQIELVDYQGGHGWHGDVFANIRAGMDWLQSKP
ncbi:MAG: hypothetical protein AAF989_01575 [Planctomycetota bacterium]